MSAATPPALRAGSPCPAGCTKGRPGREEPELLRANEDGELSCPDCWECFAILPDTERPKTETETDR